MTNLPKRLQTIANLVDEQIIIDVGSDHGLLPKYLLENNLIKFAVVTDISEKCVEKAKNTLQDFNSHTCFLCGNGLEMIDKTLLQEILKQNKIDFEPQQVVIAGMGGNEITNILSGSVAKSYNKFILQPQKNIVELRKFLMNNGFFIKKDIVVKEQKMFYTILVIEKSNKKYLLDELQLNFGKTNLIEMQQDFVDYLYFKKLKCEEILTKKEVNKIRYEYNLINKIIPGGKKNV